MAWYSHHQKILQTKPTTNIQEVISFERRRYIMHDLLRHEVGVVQAFEPHFMTGINIHKHYYNVKFALTEGPLDSLFNRTEIRAVYQCLFWCVNFGYIILNSVMLHKFQFSFRKLCSVGSNSVLMF